MSNPEQRVTEIDEYRQLTDLSVREMQLREQLTTDDFVTPDIRDAYATALDTVAEQVREISSDEGLQTRIAGVGLHCIKALNQLEPLRGLLPPEDLSTMEASVRDRLGEVVSYFNKYGALTESSRQFLSSLTALGSLSIRRASEAIGIAQSGAPVASEQPVKEPAAEPAATAPSPTPPARTPAPVSTPETPASHETDRTKRVKVIFGPDDVRFGAKGHRVPYKSYNLNKGNQDVSVERRRALQHLVKQGHTEVGPYDIWSAIHDDGRPYDTKTMTSVRTWLMGLKYRRQQVVVSNGNRGSSSRYSIAPDFQLDPEFEDIPGTEKQERTGSPEVIETDLAHIEPTSLYILAQRLKSANEVLGDFGWPTISDEMMERLRPYRPDLKYLRDKPDLLRERREDALRSVLEVFEDEQKMEELVDSFNPESPGAEFIELIYEQLGSEEGRSFMRTLLCAELKHSAVHSRGSVESINLVLVDDSGAVLWRKGQQAQSNVLEEIQEPVALEETIPTEVDEAVAPAEAVEATSNTGDDSSQEIAESPEETEASSAEKPERRKSTRKREQIDRVKQEALAMAEKFIQHFSPDESYTRRQLQMVFHNLEQKKVDDATQRARVVNLRSTTPGDIRTYGMSDFMHIGLYLNGGLRTIYQQKNNGKHIKRIISEIVTASAEKYETQKAEQAA